ncbi:uncharacterized protein LOC116117126 [Pistacia vera]|uniref:uncharacterized protein LOC116117126 n=1 Tax=Pistacia vera TaxID=55513 RepID=UPI001262CEC6|nr:uncharacterized protein LOC116117126 [Pistacia vera]
MLTVADIASNNEEDCNMLMELMTGVKNKLEQKESEGGFGSKEGDNPPKEGNSLINSPRVARSKGHPPCKRKRSKVVKIVHRAKNKKLRKQRLGKESSTERDNIAESVPGTLVLSNDIVATQLSTGPVQNLIANSNLYPGQEDVNYEHVSLGEI